jgi:MFS transporter, PPP family, 3-phenylpropionic acid transporter
MIGGDAIHLIDSSPACRQFLQRREAHMQKHALEALEREPDGFKTRLSLLFSTLFVPNAVHLAFFPVWLKDAGYSSVEISTLLSAPVLVRILATPPVTFYADRSRERAFVMMAIAAAALALSLILFVPLHFYGMLTLVCLISAAWSPQVPLADSIALSGLRRFGLDYASVRIWGSVMFLAVNVCSGFAVQRFGSAAVPPLLVMGFVSILIAAIGMPRLGRRRRLSDAGVLPSASQSLRRPAVLMFLLATGLIQGSHGYLYSFGSIYWKDSGISAQLVGFLWAVPVLAEIVLFRLYRRVFGAVRPELVLLIAGGLAVVRWTLFPVIGAADWGFWGFFAAQLLHGCTFGATYLAQQAYLAEAIPESQAGSAQGLTVFIHGLIMSAVMFLSGPLYDLTGGNGFAVMAFVALGGIGLGYWFARLHAAEIAQPQSPGSGG